MPELRPHQQEAKAFLDSHRRAYLMDEPRVGKTAPVLTALADAQPKKTLVVAPAGGVSNWRREADIWGYTGSLTVVSYAKLIAAPEMWRGWDAVVLDEAHYTKSVIAKRTQAALTAAKYAEHAWLLSGTPMPNGPHEIFTVLAALWRDDLHAAGITTLQQWLDETCDWSMGDYGPRIWRTKDSPVLQGWMAAHTLRRTFAEVYGGQPLVWGTERLDMKIPRECKGLVLPPAVEQALAAGELPGEGGHLAAYRRTLGIAKAVAAAEMLRAELTEDRDRKVLVGAWHHDVLDILQHRLGTFGAVRIDGSTSDTSRTRRRDRFNKDADVRVCIAQIQSCAEAISLSGADEVALVEQSWLPFINEQFAMRPVLMGRDPIPVRILTAPDSLDEAVAGVLSRKQRVIDAALQRAS